MIAANPALAEDSKAWRDAFQSSPAAYAPMPPDFEKLLIEKFKMPPEVADQWRPKPPVTGTVRHRFAVSASGTQLRIRVSNEEGAAPLRLSGASISLAADGFAAKPGSLKQLTFGGKRDVTVPVGAPVLSDPVEFAVTAGTELLASVNIVDAYPFEPRGAAMMALAAGDQTPRDTLEAPAALYGRPLITAAEVLSATPPRVIVALGDSITDGNRQVTGELRSWPEQLARRLAARTTGRTYAVINAGIGGNRVLAPGWGPAALARFDRDVLRIEGVSHIIVLEGSNDIGMSGKSAFGDVPLITAEELIAGYRQLIGRAHARGIKVVMGTLLPTGGSATHSSPEKQAVIQAVNTWIRTSNEADAVIDFNQITRDAAEPLKLRKAYDVGDNLHPNEAGYAAMGDAIDLSIFD